MTDLHICTGVDSRLTRATGECPNCSGDRFVILSAMYYDPVAHCVGCGDSYSAEGRGERPFARAWRKAATRRYEKWWLEAEPSSRIIAFIPGETDD